MVEITKPTNREGLDRWGKTDGYADSVTAFLRKNMYKECVEKT